MFSGSIYISHWPPVLLFSRLLPSLHCCKHGPLYIARISHVSLWLLLGSFPGFQRASRSSCCLHLASCFASSAIRPRKQRRQQTTSQKILLFVVTTLITSNSTIVFSVRFVFVTVELYTIFSLLCAAHRGKWTIRDDQPLTEIVRFSNITWSELQTENILDSIIKSPYLRKEIGKERSFS